MATISTHLIMVKERLKERLIEYLKERICLWATNWCFSFAKLYNLV
jgi:hypothetical protein